MEFSLYDMGFAAVNFMVMVVILNKFLYKPVLGIFDRRKNQIQQAQDQAQQLQAAAAQDQAQYQQALSTANQQAQAVMDKALQAAEAGKTALLEEAKAESRSIMEQARFEISREKEKMRLALQDEVAALAIQAAGKLLGRNLKPEDQERIIEEFWAEYMKTPQSEEENPLDEGQTRLLAEVCSAVPLSRAQIDTLKANLREKFGAQVSFKLTEDPQLLGGLVIRVGDQMINGSLANKMLKMQEAMQA